MRVRLTFVSLLFCVAAQPAAAQHDMAAMQMDSSHSALVWHWGIHGVGMVSRVSPAVSSKTLVEGYLTQPTLMGGVATRGGSLSLLSTISLEGLTLDRGELGPGTYGEGYVDRRHPHTYLHELVGTAHANLPYAFDGSLVVGRGFAPFGTDDPMMRPFVRFPVNHHLSQVLERIIVTGGLRRGPMTLEVGAFSGDEPSGPKDVGNIGRLGDSWSARLTVRPTSEWELQYSRAILNSPEEPTGEGDDQRKISVSARHDGMIGGNLIYGLGEFSRSTIVNRRGDVYATSSMLAEASLARSDWSTALRLERTERPEEGRIGDFRAAWPPYEHVILGITKWSVASVRAQKDVHWRSVSAAPFIETSIAHTVARDSVDLFQPRAFYGSNNLWSLSAGVRLNLGMEHERMGRYGVALPKSNGMHH